MKLSNLIWVLALAGAVAACNSGSPITGLPPIQPPPTGGSNGGGGGTGGALEGACTTEENAAVYAELEFTNSKGEMTTGTDASSAIGSECVRGSESSKPPVAGCGGETSDVIACFPNCDPPIVDALADCVTQCTGDTIERITGSRLSEDCLACTGETVACGAVFCTSECVADTTAQVCIDCRCANDCTPQFVICSGIPSDDC